MHKLLYITNGISGSGGLERVLSLRTNYLVDKLGYEVHILTLNQIGELPFYEFSDNLNFHDIQVRGNPLQYFISYRKGIKNVVSNIQPDIISVCDDGLKGLLFPLLFGKEIPIIYERHASIKFNFMSSFRQTIFNRIKSFVEQKLMILGARGFDSFVVLTEENRRDWPNVHCTVIPNMSPFTVTDNHIKSSEPLVLAVGSQTYNKGYDRLIEIWKRVNEQKLDWSLEVYGKVDEDLDLQNKANALSLNHSVSFLEPIKNIEDKYNKTSIFVMTSRSEGFGMVLIEAMSYGVPCIAFDCPHGPSDIITNDVDGFLIRDGDIESFVEKMVLLMKNKKLRLEMGKAAKKNIRRYESKNIMSEWDAVYKILMTH
jgi:glycosyltransferase involved in cell wall biosynthesis